MAFKIKLYDYTDVEGNAQCIGAPLLNGEYVGGILDANPNDNGVVNISTVGGDVYQAIAIFDAIKSHGNTDTRIDALAASAGSVIAMAGKKVIMSKYALMMIHKPMVGSGGNADELQADINMLNITQSRIAQIYMDKTGLDADTINSLINSTTWLTADQALELGFVDEIEDYTGAEITNLASMLAHTEKAAPVYCKIVFNKITTIQNDTMKIEDQKLIDETTSKLTKVTNFIKSLFGVKSVTNKGAINSMVPLAVGVAVTNEAGDSAEDGEYDVDNAGKTVKATVVNGIVTAMAGDDDDDKKDDDEDEDVQNAAVLNSVNLKVTNKAEAAGIAKVVTNLQKVASDSAALVVELTNQLKVSNEAVKRDEEKIKADIKSKFTPNGSKRSDTSGVTNTAMPKFIQDKLDANKQLSNAVKIAQNSVSN